MTHLWREASGTVWKICGISCSVSRYEHDELGIFIPHVPLIPNLIQNWHGDPRPHFSFRLQIGGKSYLRASILSTKPSRRARDCARAVHKLGACTHSILLPRRKHFKKARVCWEVRTSHRNYEARWASGEDMHGLPLTWNLVKASQCLRIRAV